MLRFSSLGRLLLVTGAAAMLAAACGGSPSTGSATPSPVDVGQGSLTGAGATFPGPFYTKAFADYSAKYPQVTVNYQAVGSGAGIQQFIKKTRSEEHTSELQSHVNLVCRLLLEKKKK